MNIIRNEELLYAERRINLEIQEISYGFLDPAWSFSNLRAAFTRVYLPLNGIGRITVGGETMELIPKHIYVIPANLNFSCECPDSLEKIYVHANLTLPDGSDLLSGINSCIVLDDTNGRIEQARELYDKRDVVSVLRFKLLLYEIFLDAMAQPRVSPPVLSEYSKHTKDALTYIDANLRATITIDEIASALFISKLLLQKNFKSDLGKPIGQYVDERLMVKSERELLDESRTIKEISDGLGFCDQFYFSRRFSQMHDGASPRQFRQKHRMISDQSRVQNTEPTKKRGQKR